MDLNEAAGRTNEQKVEFEKLHAEVEKLKEKPSEVESRVSILKETISSTGKEFAATIEGKLNKTQAGILDKTKEQQKVLLKMVNKEIRKDLEALGHEVKDLNKASEISNRKIASMSAKVAKFSEKTEPSGYLKVAIKGTREERAAKYEEKIADLAKKVAEKKGKIDKRMERLNGKINEVSDEQIKLGTAANDRLRTENDLRRELNSLDGQVKENKAQLSGKDKLTQDALKEKNTALKNQVSQLKSLEKKVKNEPIVLEDVEGNEASFKTSRNSQLEKTVKEAKILQDNMDLVMSIRPKQDARPSNIFQRIFSKLFGNKPESKISTEKYNSELAKLNKKKRKEKISPEEFDIKKAALDDKHMNVKGFQDELKNLQMKIADYAQEIKGRGEGGKKYSYIGDTMGEVEKKFDELEKFAEKNNGEYSKLFEERKENLRSSIAYFNTPSFLKDPVNQSSQYLQMTKINLEGVGWKPKPGPKNVTIREDLNIETRIEKQEPVIAEIAPEKSSNKPYIFNRDEFLELLHEYDSSPDGKAVKSAWESLLEFNKAINEGRDNIYLSVIDLEIDNKIKDLEVKLKGDNKDNFIQGLRHFSNELGAKVQNLSAKADEIPNKTSVEKSSNKPYVYDGVEFRKLDELYSSSSDGAAVRSVAVSINEFNNAVKEYQNNKNEDEFNNLMFMRLELDAKIDGLEKILKGEKKDIYIQGLRHITNEVYNRF